MSVPTVLTQGFGNGTFAGAVADVVLRGFVLPSVSATKRYRIEIVPNNRAMAMPPDPRRIEIAPSTRKVQNS